MILGHTYWEHDRAYQHYFCPRALCLGHSSKTVNFVWSVILVFRYFDTRITESTECFAINRQLLLTVVDWFIKFDYNT